MITENRQAKSICSGDKLAKVIGLELCGELQFPNASLVDSAPYFPMTGPVKMGITLYKRDTHTGYKLQAKSIHVSICTSNTTKLVIYKMYSCYTCIMICSK